MKDQDSGKKFCTRKKHLVSLEKFGRRGKKDERKRSWCKDCAKEVNAEKYWWLKREVLSHYSTKNESICARCGDTDLKNLCLDHVNGGGREHLISIGLYNKNHDKILSGTPFYLWLKNEDYPKDPPLQVLCKDCNGEKQIQNGER